jgi:hypothetical protein
VAVIVDAEPKVIGPLKEAFPPVFVNAPAGNAVSPVPFNVNGSAVDNVNPFKSSTAPLITEVIPAIVPKAELLPNFKVPALIVVAPVYEFVPERDHVPAPFFTTDVGVVRLPDIIPEHPDAPSNVNPNAPVAIVPLVVSVPELVAVILLAEPNVIAPE